LPTVALAFLFLQPMAFRQCCTLSSHVPPMYVVQSHCANVVRCPITFGNFIWPCSESLPDCTDSSELPVTKSVFGLLGVRFSFSTTSSLPPMLYVVQSPSAISFGPVQHLFLIAPTLRIARYKVRPWPLRSLPAYCALVSVDERMMME